MMKTSKSSTPADITPVDDKKISSKVKRLLSLPFSSPNEKRGDMVVTTNPIDEATKGKGLTITELEKVFSEEEFDVAFCHAQFSKCDESQQECQKFLEEATETINFTKNNTSNSEKTQIPDPKKTRTGSYLGMDLSMGASKSINKWRAKQKQNNLFARYEPVTSGAEMSDAVLSYLTDKSLGHSSALVIQCNHLKPRLTACVDFNIKELEFQSPLVREANLVLDILKESEVTLQNMLVFYDEIGHLKDTELRIKQHAMMTYVPWAQRNNSITSSAEKEEDVHPDSRIQRKTIEKRLRKTRKMIAMVDNNLTTLVATYDVRKKNFERCSKALQTMTGVLRKIMRAPVAAEAIKDFDIDNEDDNEDDDDNDSDKEPERNTKELHPVSTSNSSSSSSDSGSSSSSRSGASLSESVPTETSTQLFPETDEQSSPNSERKSDTSIGTGKKDRDKDKDKDKDKNEDSIRRHAHAKICADCSCTFTMVNECLINLATNQMIAEESTRRHQVLSKLREQLATSAKALEEMEWDKKAEIQSPFKERKDSSNLSVADLSARGSK